MVKIVSKRVVRNPGQCASRSFVQTGLHFERKRQICSNAFLLSLDFSPLNGYQGGIVAQNNQDQIPDTYPHSLVSGLYPQSLGYQGMQHFCFFPINGSGMGHLSRCLSYARRLESRAYCSFFTLASAIEYVERMGFAAEYFISPFWSCNSTYHWNTELAVRLGMFLEHMQPNVIVFDGTWPFQGFLSTVKAYRKKGHSLKMVWSKRGLLKKSAKVCPVDERLFDMILEPGELDATPATTILDNGTTRKVTVPPHGSKGMRSSDSAHDDNGTTRKVTVPPVTLMRDEEILDRDTACQALGLAPDKHHVLFSLGSGNLKDVNSLGQRLVRAFQEKGLSPVWACPPISVHDIELPRDVRAISVYPLVQYLRAFDVLVGAAGYNTCCEIVQTGTPSLLIPNTLLADNQTKRANLIANYAPVVVNPCETDEDMARALDEVTGLLRGKICFPRAQMNGAELGAEALLNLTCPQEGGEEA